ncbi:MAG TPA: hypothetical protein VG734_15140 [Lacunisphaera sp.]|nr:hypothetical protein [Lacunisphaera sp.]
MEIYLPTLESKMVRLVGALRFIVFAIMVVGLIAYACGQHGQGSSLFFAIAKAVVVVAAAAYMDTWFPKVEQFFLSVAEYVDPGYNENPTAASDILAWHLRFNSLANTGSLVGKTSPSWWSMLISTVFDLALEILIECGITTLWLLSVGCISWRTIKLTS